MTAEGRTKSWWRFDVERRSSAREEARSDLLTQRLAFLIGGEVGDAPMEAGGAARGEAAANAAARETVRVARMRHSASGGRLRLPARRGRRGCIPWIVKMTPVDAIPSHNVGNPSPLDGILDGMGCS